MPEYGLRNFLGSREGSKVGIESGEGFQRRRRERRGVGVGVRRTEKEGDGGTIQYAPGAPT